jgi:hypothetical protein
VVTFIRDKSPRRKGRSPCYQFPHDDTRHLISELLGDPERRNTI